MSKPYATYAPLFWGLVLVIFALVSCAQAPPPTVFKESTVKIPSTLYTLGPKPVPPVCATDLCFGGFVYDLNSDDDTCRLKIGAIAQTQVEPSKAK